MTPQAVLADLLDRLKARPGEAPHIAATELSEWPAGAVAAMKSARLLLKARPASSIVCPGCEKQCLKDVDVFPAEGGRPARAFVHCDEPEDVGRIPVDLANLDQWRLSGDAKPAALARALGVPLREAKTGAPLSRQSERDAAIRSKYEELARAGKRNYVKEIQGTVPGADSLSDRRIRDIAKDR